MRPTLAMISLGALVAVSAPAQSHPIETATTALAQTLARKLPDGATVGLMPLRDGMSHVPCNPLSERLTNALQQALLAHLDGWGTGIAVTELTDPAAVQAVAIGDWAVGTNEIGVTVKVLDPLGPASATLAQTTFSLPRKDLSPGDESCLLAFEPVDRAITIAAPRTARLGPWPTADVVRDLPAGIEVQVTARVTTTDKNRWAVVRLPDDSGLNLDLGRYGFVVDLLPAPPAPVITPLDERRRTSGPATVRTEARISSPRLAEVPLGTDLAVTGRLTGPEDGDWFRVETGGGIGYVLATVLPTPTTPSVPPAPSVPVGRAPGFEARVRADRHSYRAGELLTVTIEGNQDFYGHLVYRTVDGGLVTLVPNRARPDNRFRAGVTYRLPGPRDGFRIRLTCDPACGPESLFLFASTQPLAGSSGSAAGSLADIKAEVFSCLFRGDDRDVLNQPATDCSCGFRGAELAFFDPAAPAPACYTASWSIVTRP